MLKVTAQPGIEQISLYEGGLAKLGGRDNVIKLSSNENPLGPSDGAIEAFRRASFDLHRYPSTDHVIYAKLSGPYLIWILCASSAALGVMKCLGLLPKPMPAQVKR